MTARQGTGFSAARIASRVATLGKQISRACEGRRLDVVVTLLVDAVLDSGVTQDFLLRRLGESKPRSLRLAVLVDKLASRRVALEPDYFGFRTASKQVWVGYGLAAPNGMGRNLPRLSPGLHGAARKTGKVRKKEAR